MGHQTRHGLRQLLSATKSYPSPHKGTREISHPISPYLYKLFPILFISTAHQSIFHSPILNFMPCRFHALGWREKKEDCVCAFNLHAIWRTHSLTNRWVDHAMCLLLLSFLHTLHTAFPHLSLPKEKYRKWLWKGARVTGEGMKWVEALILILESTSGGQRRRRRGERTRVGLRATERPFARSICLCICVRRWLLGILGTALTKQRSEFARHAKSLSAAVICFWRGPVVLSFPSFGPVFSTASTPFFST